jgi:hypothetical protein
MTSAMKVLLMSSLAALAAVPVTASQTPAPAPAARQQAGPPPGRPGRPDGPGNDEEMRAAMEQVMVVRLKRALRLTPEQETRVMPKVEDLMAARRETATRRRGAVSHLRAVMIDETASDAEIVKAIKDVRAIDDDFRSHEQALKDDIGRELTPRQQARLYFFEENFRRAMQRRMFDAMQRRGPGGPPGAPDRAPAAAPPDPEDDPGDDGGL